MKIGEIMKDDDNLKYLVEMSQSLAGINGKMTMLCDMIAAHETRLQHLEDKQSSVQPQAPQAPQAAPYFQNNLLQMALKAILFATATAMALAGAGKFLEQ